MIGSVEHSLRPIKALNARRLYFISRKIVTYKSTYFYAQVQIIRMSRIERCILDASSAVTHFRRRRAVAFIIAAPSPPPPLIVPGESTLPDGGGKGREHMGES